MMELYCNSIGPPSRAVKLTAEYIGVTLKIHQVDVFKGEHMTPEFEKINPAKKIPFLVDGDFKINESRAIMIYLVEKYGKNSRILPSDPCGRAVVNQVLHFDISKLFKSMVEYYFPVMFKMEETHSPEKFEKLKDNFATLDRMLESQDFVAGRNLTIADLSIITTVTTLEVFGFEVDKYKNVVKWIEKIKVAAPGFKKIEGEGTEGWKKLIADMSGN